MDEDRLDYEPPEAGGEDEHEGSEDGSDISETRGQELLDAEEEEGEIEELSDLQAAEAQGNEAEMPDAGKAPEQKKPTVRELVDGFLNS